MELEEFVKIFKEQFDDVEPDVIEANTEYQELDEWSSLTAMSLIAMAKTKFGKTITGREVRSCSTVEDLFNLISAK